MTLKKLGALLCGLTLIGPGLAQAQTRDTAVVLSQLLAIDTTNAPGDTRAAAAYLKQLFDEAGIPNQTIVAPNGKAAHFIARLQGDGTQRPVLIAAHTDVVPVQRERWSVDPFAGVQKDGFVYGRGALDNKGAVAQYAQAVIRLSRDPAPRRRDVIFLAEADEEQGAFSTGWLAEHHWDKIDAEFALNEGGRTVLEPGGKVSEMQVTYADKQTLNLKIKTRGPTGHSSRPLPLTETANGQLVTALGKLAAFEAAIELTPQARRYLEGTARLNPGPMAQAIERLLQAKGSADQARAAKQVIAADPGGVRGLEGVMRDTLVVTMINAGQKPNVIPGDAEAVMNARLLPGKSVDGFIAQVAAAIDNPRVEIEVINSRPKAELAAFFARRSAIKPSRLDTALYSAIETAAAATWPGITVTPALMIASTDAPAWRERDVPVYGLTPAPTDDDTAARIHGDDERIGIAQLREGEDFAYRVLKIVTAR